MSFGLTNSPADCIYLFDRVFQNYLSSSMIVFIYDILVYLMNEGEHVDHLRMAFQVLKEHQLLAKYSKCGFLLRLLAFLGHITSREGIEVNPMKNEAVKNWPTPLTMTNNRCFLVLARCYRSFVDGLTSIAFPFTTLNKKNIKFVWLEACERRFQISKDRLTSSPIITLLECTKGFVIYFDAS